MVTWGVAGTHTDEQGVEPATATEESGVAMLLGQLQDRKEAVGKPIPRATDSEYTGRTARLRLPGTDPMVTGLDCDAQYSLTTAAELPEGKFLLSATVETNGDGDPLGTERSRVHVRFGGPASLTFTDGEILLSLWESQRVTVGIGERLSVGPARIRIPASVEGLATGLSNLSSAHHTMAPSRSHPGQRGHPPLLTTGASLSIPDEVESPDTGIELRLPDSVAALDRCSLSPPDVRALSPAGRLARYLETPTEAVAAAVPEWHLSTHTQPSLARARCLPFLLDPLSLIYLSDGVELERRDLLDSTLSDSFQTRGVSEATTMVEPTGGTGRVHGWLAPGTPIDAFKTMPTAYENRYRYSKSDTDRLQLSVVLNEMEMTEEHRAVSEIYRAADLPMNVTVSDGLTTGELADVFESDNDFVHFIGHCEDDGLACPDGTLSMASLAKSRTRTFFLNACGSYEEGLELIEQGAVAGAVTFTDVLDRHAAMVGTAFARLLSNGFSIQRALQLARRRIMMGKDYAVVGDGTYALLPGPTAPIVVRVTAGEGQYHLTCEVLTPTGAGESYQLPFEGRTVLNGTETSFSVDPETLVETLRATSLPAVFEGEFHWSGDLAARLDASFSAQ